MDANYVNYCAKNMLNGLSCGHSDMSGYIDMLASSLNYTAPYNLPPEHKMLWLLAATIAALTEPKYGP